MSEGLTDEDRAKIEAARQTASGCLGPAGCFVSGFAALMTAGFLLFIPFALPRGGPGGPTVSVVAAVIAIFWVVALGFIWLWKQNK
jgi:hypothetical protein